MSRDEQVLAQYVDDCWEPAEAATILRELAEQAGTPLCLRILGDDVDHAEPVPVDRKCDHERPGTASYFWVLWSGPLPTREELIALYKSV